MKNNYKCINDKMQFHCEYCEKRYYKEMNEEYENDSKAFDFNSEMPLSDFKIDKSETLSYTKHYKNMLKDQELKDQMALDLNKEYPLQIIELKGSDKGWTEHYKQLLEFIHKDFATQIDSIAETTATCEPPNIISKTININDIRPKYNRVGKIETITNTPQQEDFKILPDNCETRILGIDLAKDKSYSKEFTIKVGGEEIGKATSFEEPIIKRVFSVLAAKDILSTQKISEMTDVEYFHHKLNRALNLTGENEIKQSKQTITHGGNCTKCKENYPYADITDVNTFQCWACRNKC